MIYERFAGIYNNSLYTNFSAKMSETAIRMVTRSGVSFQRTLDLACGVGVAAVYFADKRYDVAAIDRSQAMLDCARRRAQEAGVSIDFSQQDMRTFKLDQPVDLVTCMYGSLNYMLTDDDLAAVFRQVEGALNPAGLFIFDVSTAYGLATSPKNLIHEDKSRNVIMHENEFDYERLLNTKKLTFFAQTGRTYERFVEVHKEKAHSLKVIDKALSDSGLDVIDKFSGTELDPVGPDSARVVYLSRRKK